MLESALLALVGLVVVTVRVCGRVALARHRRRAVTEVAAALATAGRSGRATQRASGEEWTLELGALEGDRAR